MSLGVAIGNESKRVEAVTGRWVSLDSKLPALTVVIGEMGLDPYSGDLYADRTFSNNYEVAWVFVKNGVMTMVEGGYTGEITTTKTETDLETGKSKSSTFLSPKFSLEKVGVYSFYIGPASVNPFNSYPVKPEIVGELLPKARG
jgi:hypothetical protein